MVQYHARGTLAAVSRAECQVHTVWLPEDSRKKLLYRWAFSVNLSTDGRALSRMAGMPFRALPRAIRRPFWSTT